MGSWKDGKEERGRGEAFPLFSSSAPHSPVSLLQLRTLPHPYYSPALSRIPTAAPHSPLFLHSFISTTSPENNYDSSPDSREPNLLCAPSDDLEKWSVHLSMASWLFVQLKQKKTWGKNKALGRGAALLTDTNLTALFSENCTALLCLMKLGLSAN